MMNTPTATPAGTQAATPAAGAFVPVRRLGAGAMGQVMLAFDHNQKTLVALKRPHAHLVAQGLASLDREYAALAACDHPNLNRLLAAGTDANGPYLALEWLAGVSLAEWLAGPQRNADKIRLFVGIATGLAALHAAGFVHRDLKPDNILVKTDGTPVIIDFGLVKNLAGEAKPLSGFVGTVLYAAPEQAAGQADARSDLYSLGVMMYQAFAGEVPFMGNDFIEVLRQHQQASPRPLTAHNAEVPLALEALVLALLAKQPDQRPQSAWALVEALLALLQPAAAVVVAVVVTVAKQQPLPGWMTTARLVGQVAPVVPVVPVSARHQYQRAPPIAPPRPQIRPQHFCKHNHNSA
jgi:eukaryotic-like serine/threonine-protein kinase